MASRSLGSLTVDLILKMGGFKQGADAAAREIDSAERRITARTKKIQDSFRSMGRLFAGAFAGLGLAQVIRATADAERAFAELTNAVRNNGGAVGRTAEELADASQELQSLTTFSDDAIQSMQALLLKFSSIRGDEFDRATMATLDLAAALGTDLPAAAKLIGRALEDPVAGLSRLARAGIIFSAQQKRVIEDLVNTGKSADAQRVILDALDAKVKGSAAAMRNNFGGALAGLKNAFGDLLEGKDGIPAATEAINDLTDALSNPETKRAADSLIGALARMGAVAVQGLSAPISFLDRLGNSFERTQARIEKGLGLDIPPEVEQRLFSTESKIKSITERIAFLQEIDKRQGTGGFNTFNRIEVGLLEKRLAYLREIVKVEAESRPILSGPSNPRGRSQAPSVPSEDNLDAIDRIVEQTKSAAQKYNEAINELKRLQKLSPEDITPEVFATRVKQLKEELNKPVKIGTSDTQREVNSARESVERFTQQLIEQRDTLGLTETQSLRYSITQGEIARSLDKLGASAGPLREKLIGLADAVGDGQATQQATQQIDDQIRSLETQAATLGLTEQQAFAYSVTQGEIAKSLSQMKEGAEAATVRLLELNNQQAATRAEIERRSEETSIFESTRTDAERYILTLEHLQEVFRSSSDQVTYGRAVADAAAEMVEGRNAAEEYRLTIEELNKQMAGGLLTQEAYEAAIGRAQETFAEAGREAGKVFAEEARRNTQDVLADFLTDPFSKGLDGLVEDFGKTFQRIAANAVAARIADKLFDGFDGWLDKLGGLFGGGGGGGILASIGSFFGFAGGGYTGDGGKYEPAGIVHKGEGVLSQREVRAIGGPSGFQSLRESINRFGADLIGGLPGYAEGGFVGGMPAGHFGIPSTATLAMAGGPRSEPVNITQNFMLQAPQGSVSRATQQQVGAEAYRGAVRAAGRTA
jgi:hypothetical protein